MTTVAAEGAAGAASRRWSAGDSWWLVVLAPVALLVVAGVRFVHVERTLYAADRVAHWAAAISLAKLLATSPLRAAAAIGASLANSDLNLLPTALPATVMAALGSGRAVFVGSVALLYGLATAAALVTVARSHVEGRVAEAACGLAVSLALFPSLFRPVLLGAVGLGGVALGVLVLLLTWTGPLSLRRAAGAGLLLAVLVLFRRWYLLWAIAWVPATIAVATLRGRLEGSSSRRRLSGSALVTAVVAGSTVALVSLPVVLRRLTAGYTDEFAGYRRLGGLDARLSAVADELGLVAIVVVVAALVTLWRNPRTRALSLGLAVQPLLCWLGMLRLQDHDLHHWYLYMPAMTFAVAAALPRWVGSSASRRRRRLVVFGLATAGFLQTAAVGWPAFGPIAGRVAPLLPRSRVEPAVRHDLTEVRRLLGDLDRALAVGPGPVYVLASSERLSDQILAFAPLSLGTDVVASRSILGSAHVDRRDGFPVGLLRARYVLVADPPQIHLRPEEQQVILVPVASFAAGSDVARAFTLWTGTYELDGGVTVRVFERVRSHTSDEVAALASKLQRAHPDLPAVYTPW